VLVPGGPFVAGSSGAAEHTDDPFGTRETDNPQRIAEVTSFRIDRTAVTNERYARFLSACEHVQDRPSPFCHPDEPEGKDHIPAHWLDSRFNQPSHPVVGVDWYDAWAFSRWADGRLPSEDEWEKAARGEDARKFPWGNHWNPAMAQSVLSAFGRDALRDRLDLERLLAQTSPTWPPRPVVPADSMPQGASPYGVLNMAGNVWEFTRTNFYTRRDMRPAFKSRRSSLAHLPEAFPAIRGGTWTSPSVCLTTYYRGRELLTARSNTAGFRCVYDAA
jgi:formylglycine-generating enzyme required for sulfatase activity